MQTLGLVGSGCGMGRGLTWTPPSLSLLLPRKKPLCGALSCLQAAVLAETRRGTREGSGSRQAPAPQISSDATGMGKSLPFPSFYL